MKRVTLMMLVLAALPAAGFAAEFTYSARVLDAKPVQVSQKVDDPDESCYSAKPTDFHALLAWDINCSRPRTVEVTRYRVTYKIDDRTFTTMVASLPGDHIPVRVQFF